MTMNTSQARASRQEREGIRLQSRWWCREQWGMSDIGRAIRLTVEHLRSKGNGIWQVAYSRSNSITSTGPSWDDHAPSGHTKRMKACCQTNHVIAPKQIGGPIRAIHSSTFSSTMLRALLPAIVVITVVPPAGAAFSALVVIETACLLLFPS